MRIQRDRNETPWHQCKFLAETNDAFTKGETYDLYFQWLSGLPRLQVYKKSTVAQHSGHKVYDSLDDLKKSWELDETDITQLLSWQRWKP